MIVLDHREIITRASIFDACDAHNITILHTNASHTPAVLSIPLFGHTFANNFFERQVSVSIPTKKQLWTMIVAEKIRGQIQNLKNDNIETEWLETLLWMLRSGDPENIEWQVAAKYFRLLFWKNFIRERDAEGINAFLNYGYALIRAAIARAVVAGGLYPSIGIWHHNQYNYFNLVDDLIEPFRPLVDARVKQIFSDNAQDRELTSFHKQELLTILTIDIEYNGRKENFTSLLEKYISSFREWLLESQKFQIPKIHQFLQK